MIVSEWIQRLQNEFKPDQHICIHLWQTDDVISKANEMGVAVTEEEAEDVIEGMEHHIDSSLGVSWITVECGIDDFIHKEDPVAV